MSRVGLDWYKREPIAYLGDVQGLTSKEHAVYSVVLELIYIHGGAIRNDPKFISGWIADIGAASVRKVLASLSANPRITLVISDDEISQKRAQNEVKTKQKLRENAQKSGSKGGEKTSELKRMPNKNNGLGKANPAERNQAEKKREDKIEKETKVSKKKAQRLSEDWALPEEWKNMAMRKGMPEERVLFEAKQMHVWSRTSPKGAKLDWRLVWQGWVRRWIDDNPQKLAAVKRDDLVVVKRGDPIIIELERMRGKKIIFGQRGTVTIVKSEIEQAKKYRSSDMEDVELCPLEL